MGRYVPRAQTILLIALCGFVRYYSYTVIIVIVNYKWRSLGVGAQEAQSCLSDSVPLVIRTAGLAHNVCERRYRGIGLMDTRSLI